MKPNDVIPVKKEFLFILKIVGIMVASIGSAFLVLSLLLYKNVGMSFKGAFQAMAAVYERLNIYIILAVLVQLVFSTIIVYLSALLYSHKIAGPVYRLKMILQGYLDGDCPDSVRFRQHDFLPGVAHWFTDFFTFLGKRKKQLNEAEQLAVRLKQPGLSQEEKNKILEDLDSLVKRLEGEV